MMKIPSYKLDRDAITLAEASPAKEWAAENKDYITPDTIKIGVNTCLPEGSSVNDIIVKKVDVTKNHYVFTFWVTCYALYYNKETGYEMAIIEFDLMQTIQGIPDCYLRRFTEAE